MVIKLKTFTLVLDRPGAVYRPLDVLSGQCILQLDGEMHLSQLTITMKGRAECEWTEQVKQPKHSGRRSSETVSASGSATSTSSVNTTETIRHYQRYNCVELPYYPGNIYPSVLHNGQHIIAFNFQLPDRIPATYDGQYGRIRYWLKAHIKQDGPDETTIQPFTVQTPAYVSIQELTQPVLVSKDKTVGLIGGKPLILRCQLHSRGHNVGHSIPVHCFIDNQSKKSMILKAALKQEVQFTANGVNKQTRQKLTRGLDQTVGASTQTNTIVELQVPPNAPVVHSVCPIISIKYQLSVKLDIPGSFDLKCDLPIILTNEPIAIGAGVGAGVGITS
ncbi:arrestin domain-containing protein 3-like [Oppia nitens]|uniref:arrestin domain-containing protein 3-like n=1 Tax=Oppia nitens TaxID=1686743 RepID=UPI0023DC283B|nr:arrestin domain-containing protein 3-like [Oppia nitens]